jgi:SAM-dependent methyltransferase
MIFTETNTSVETDAFFRQYIAPDEIAKYSQRTAGHGINYLLDHDYKAVYLQALQWLPATLRQEGIRILEFGCGAGMNLLHVISVLRREGIKVASAIGTDFSPTMVQTAKREAQDHLREDELHKLDFHVARNESIIADLTASAGIQKSSLRNSFHFILGVNTVRYCHAAKKEMNNARDLFDLLVPGGVSVVIDMNNRFPLFRSDLKNRLCWKKEKQCYVPSLEEYATPFIEVGFEILRREHFCWVPHSAGKFMTGLFRQISPALNTLVKSRAMRSLVVSRKPTARH